MKDLKDAPYFIIPRKNGPTPVPEGYTGAYVRDDILSYLEDGTISLAPLPAANPANVSIDFQSNSDKLQSMFTMQEKLMHEYGVHPKQIQLWPFGSLSNFMSKVVYATIREVVEIGDELPWKWWRKNREIDMIRIREEIIDLLHFVLELAILADLDPSSMYSMYQEKNAINFKRIHQERLNNNNDR